MKMFSDDFGSRMPVIHKQFQAKSAATSIVSGVPHHIKHLFARMFLAQATCNRYRNTSGYVLFVQPDMSDWSSELGGRTLDPCIQFIAHNAAKQPPMSSLDPARARMASAEGLAMLSAKPEPGVSFEDFELEAPGRAIPVRLYRPASQTASVPMMVYLHMGGGVIGDLEICHVFCSILANVTGGPVLSVDYRLAPEHKFPAGLEDSIFAYEWALKNAEKYGAPAGRAALGGDSMGGNFTAIIAQEMKRQHKPLPDLQLMIYPATDIVSSLPSREIYGDTYPLSTDTMDWFMDHYLAEGQDKEDVRISPAFETSLDGLPSAVLVTAGFDPLVDEGEAYAKRLEACGVRTLYKCYDTLAHGFTAFTAITPAADAACREIAGFVKTLHADSNAS